MTDLADTNGGFALGVGDVDSCDDDGDDVGEA